jgi:hypothetical protein
MEKPSVNIMTRVSDWFRVRVMFRDYAFNYNIPVDSKAGPLDGSDSLNQKMIYSMLNGSMASMDSCLH